MVGGVEPLRVGAIWRFPVKSCGGERITAGTVALTDQGIVGDRAWGLCQRSTGNILTARRRGELLFASSRIEGDEVILRLPDGTETNDDAVLSAWLGEEVALVRADENAQGTYETPTDAEHEDAAPWKSWRGPVGSFHDSPRSRVSLVSETTLGSWDPRRFRANVVLVGSGEDALVGSHIDLGTATVVVNKHIDRCVMVTRPQPGLERDLAVLRTINRDRNSVLAIGANVVRPGMVAVGDPVVPHTGGWMNPD